MKGTQYRHLSLTFNKTFFDIKIDEQGVYVGKRVKGTQGDDNIYVYHDSQIDGDGIGGDDGNDQIFYFCEKNRTLSGGKGDDEIKVTSANHIISGDEGYDKIWGGTGNDTYCFKRGDGVDEIIEQVGEDHLKLMGDIRADQVWLKRHLNHLKVIIGENGADYILFHGYFEGPEHKIEQISLPDGSYLLTNYKQQMAVLGQDFKISLNNLDKLNKAFERKLPVLKQSKKWPGWLFEDDLLSSDAMIAERDSMIRQIENDLNVIFSDHEAREIQSVTLDKNKQDLCFYFKNEEGREEKLPLFGMYGPEGDLKKAYMLSTKDGLVIEHCPDKCSEGEKQETAHWRARYNVSFDRTLVERTKGLLINYIEIDADHELNTLAIGNTTSMLPENIKLYTTEEKIREQILDPDQASVVNRFVIEVMSGFNQSEKALPCMQKALWKFIRRE